MTREQCAEARRPLRVNLKLNLRRIDRHQIVCCHASHVECFHEKAIVRQGQRAMPLLRLVADQAIRMNAVSDHLFGAIPLGRGVPCDRSHTGGSGARNALPRLWPAVMVIAATRSTPIVSWAARACAAIPLR
jgi:hypothetical protein